MVQHSAPVNADSAEIRAAIGERLRQERVRLGYNQADFAALGGSSKRSQIDWEKGTATPNAEFLHLVGKGGADVCFILIGKRNETIPERPFEVADHRVENAHHFVDQLKRLLAAARLLPEDDLKALTKVARVMARPFLTGMPSAKPDQPDQRSKPALKS